MQIVSIQQLPLSMPGAISLKSQSTWISQLVYGAKNKEVTDTVGLLTNSGPRTRKSWRRTRTNSDLTRPLLNKSP